MKELGGYIEMEYFRGQPYHPHALPLNSGRHALQYLLLAKHLKKLYLPKFLCRSVSDICRKVGVEVEYYSIDRSFCPVFDRGCKPGEALYVVNYYGQLSDARLLELQAQHGALIVDNAQAFFRMPLPGVDTLYTCRKFFGVADGSYLYTDARLAQEPAQDISCDRMLFLMGRLELSAGEYYAQYTENNRHFSQAPLKRMSKLTENLLRGIDYDFVSTQRRENFCFLHAQLREQNPLALAVPEGAFMYPLYLPNGSAVRKQLQEKKIFIPTLWPDVFDLCVPEDLEYDMAKNILPLPCDQRYNETDMAYLTKEVLACIG